MSEIYSLLIVLGQRSDMEQNKFLTIVSWALRIVVAGILLQTLFFKFTGARESVYIFTKLGIEPWGRIASGIVELIAAVLLIVPRTASLGAVLALGVISGAIMSHLTKLGIVVQNSDGSTDGGLLFVLALTVFIGSAIVLFIHRYEIPVFGQFLKQKFES